MVLKEQVAIEINKFLIEQEDIFPWSISYKNDLTRSVSFKHYGSHLQVPTENLYEFKVKLASLRSHIKDIPERLEFSRKDYLVTALLEGWSYEDRLNELYINYTIIIEDDLNDTRDGARSLQKYYRAVSRANEERAATNL